MYSLFFGTQTDKSVSSWRRWCLIAAIIPFLSACSSFGGNKKPLPRCPTVFLLKNANSITYFKPGPIRDITDILATVAIIDFTGECKYNKKRTKANIRLNVTFDIRRGPADRQKATGFRYFVAIPKFHPSPNGKSIFPLRAQFQGNQTRVTLLDEISIEIPMSKNPKVDEYSVFIGLQLTPRQLKYNRSQVDRVLRH